MTDATSEFERSLLRNPDVKFGAENQELLSKIGAFARQLINARVHLEADGGTTPGISTVDASGLDEGPTLLTLVRLAHAAGNRLVISIAEADGSGDCVEVLRI